MNTAAGSSNGRTHDSESCNLGSSPGPAAVFIKIVNRTHDSESCNLGSSPGPAAYAKNNKDKNKR